MPGILLGLALLLMLAVWGVRASVLRCHDLGFKGWWSLATLIPVVGFIAGLALLLVPGQKEHNAWGPRRRPVGIPALAGALVVAVAGAGVMARFTPDGLPDPSRIAGLASTQQGDEAAFMARYDAHRDRIVMYSLTTCGYCTEKRRQFEHMGVRFTEYMIDEDSAAEDRLNAHLQRAGITGAIGTPILEVNGQILPNNPSLSILAHHLYGRGQAQAKTL
jgi:glutaredoxin